ncbi:MAG: (Fe-S)-binding protein [Promethearchaeota archaeon]
MNVPEEVRDSAVRCLRCSMCKWIPQVQIKSQKFAGICPSVDHFNFHTYSGGGKLLVARSMLAGRLDPKSLPPDELEEFLKVVYGCTLCGGCDVACKYLNSLEPLEASQALREMAVEEGLGPLPAHQRFADNVARVHNPYGEPHEDRLAWLPDDVELTPGARLVYFVGCTSSYRRKEIAAATARVLKAAGVEFDALGGEEFCCGSPLLRVGHRERFLEVAKHNLEALKQRKVKTVVASCAGCYSAFKAEYPRLAGKYGFKILHTTEFFELLLRRGKLRLTNPVRARVTYHDPCHLGRGSEPYGKRKFRLRVKVRGLVRVEVPPKPLRRGERGVYDPPREVLRQIPGVELVEMERAREYAYCCGAGGGVKAAFPGFAEATGARRLEEAEATGAEVLASACPFCATNLSDAIASRGSSLRFADVSQLLERAL